MKYRLLQWMACPNCRGAQLTLSAFQIVNAQSPPEIMQGLLECSQCGKLYPVVDGIPRMLPDSYALYHTHLSRFSTFALPSPEAASTLREFRRLYRSTQESFSFQWLRYRVTGFQENVQFFVETMGITPAELQGKLVLEAGCGMGRFMEVAASWGAEVVGIDLSRSVERAWRETAGRSRVHLIQGDLMKPPLRPETFDLAYSIGVLHHTPDTRQAFQSLCQFVRPGGRISVWIYRTFQPEIPVGLHKRAFAFLSQIVSDGTRSITTRMPHGLLHYLCFLAVPLGWMKRTVYEHTILKYLFWPVALLPISAHRHRWVRSCETFDWLSPKYQWKHTTQEVMEWFEAEGLEQVRSLDRAVSVTGVKPAGASKPRTSAHAPTERIRVLQFVNFFFIGGTEGHVLKLARGLDRCRFEVHLGCLSREGDLLKEIEALEIPIAEYSIQRLYGTETLKQQVAFARYLRLHRIQIVHTYGFYPNVFALPVARLAGVPAVIASIRDTGDMWTPVQRRLQKLACGLAHHIAVNSEAVRRRLILEGYNPRKITVIPNGVDPARFARKAGKKGARIRRAFGIPSDAPVVALLSRLNHQIKGAHYFLEAAALASRSSCQVYFLIIGDGAYKEELRQQALRLGLGPRAIFAGFRLDVPELLAEATISVLPSLSEGLSNTLLESMAAGIPVVATRVGGNPEVVEDGVTGVLVPPGDSVALAQSVCRLLDNLELAAQLGRAGRERVVREFSLEKMLRGTERLYLDLLAAQSGLPVSLQERPA